MTLVEAFQDDSLLLDATAPFPAEVEFVISALEAGPKPIVDRQKARRSIYRVRATLKLFSDALGSVFMRTAVQGAILPMPIDADPGLAGVRFRPDAAENIRDGISRRFDGPHHSVSFIQGSSQNTWFRNGTEIKFNAGITSNLRMEDEGGGG